MALVAAIAGGSTPVAAIGLPLTNPTPHTRHPTGPVVSRGSPGCLRFGRLLGVVSACPVDVFTLGLRLAALRLAGTGHGVDPVSPSATFTRLRIGEKSDWD